MAEELVPHDRTLLGIAIRREDHEWPIAVVEHEPHGEALMAAQIERFRHEPVAAAFRGLETVESKAGILLGRGARREQERERGAAETKHRATKIHDFSFAGRG